MNVRIFGVCAMECMWNTCVHRLDLGLYSNLKEFWGNGVRTHVYFKGKIPSTKKILPREGSNPRRCIKQDSEPNTLPTSYSAPPPSLPLPQPSIQAERCAEKIIHIYQMDQHDASIYPCPPFPSLSQIK